MDSYQFTVTERFLRYVQVDTEADPHSGTHPSSEKQKNLSKILVTELLEMGIQDAHTDEYGYVYGTIPVNTSRKVPVICFCSHIDTAPDCSGKNVKPLLHKQYQGNDIVLPDDPAQVISIKDYPYLSSKVGSDIITASGNTLLGADDKSGVAIIMDMAHYLLNNPEVKHGEIKILFTPDEEIGEGTEKVDLKKLAADFAYTLDGGELGTFEDETFSANSVQIILHGVSAHPGYAKGKMVNALKISGELLAQLPKDSWSPETTSHKEGFVHPLRIDGNAEKVTLEFIVRDFNTEKMLEHMATLKSVATSTVSKFPKAHMEFIVKEQYRNMKEVLDQFPQVSAFAAEAYKRAGLEVINEPIRGGTDGSRLSFMGLPCPNIFTGMQAIHSKHEWIAVNDMEKAVQVLIELVKVWEEKS
ncbi:MAG: peptidase T [Bacteroidetes bacterium]|nr:peptidase T [Bacteroidota bacterium]